jgi:hypothetical protein
LAAIFGKRFKEVLNPGVHPSKVEEKNGFFRSQERGAAREVAGGGSSERTQGRRWQWIVAGGGGREKSGNREKRSDQSYLHDSLRLCEREIEDRLARESFS